jgi:hypothetical protein
MIKPGKGLLGSAVDEDDPWADRVDRLQRGVGDADPTIDALKPSDPNIDRAMESDDDARLNQAPGYPVEGTLPVKLRRAIKALQSTRGSSV